MKERFKDQFDAVPVEEHEDLREREFPEGSLANQEATIMLIPSDAEVIGMMDADDYDENPSEIVETEERTNDGEMIDVVVFVKDGTYTTIGGHLYDKVQELADREINEEDVELIIDEGDVLPPKFDVGSEYSIIVGPYQTKPGMGKSLTTPPSGYDPEQ